MENLKPCPFCGGKAFIENGYVGIEKVACLELMNAAREMDNEEMYGQKSAAFSVFVEAKLTLDAMPTVDDVQVVRCEDCKHHEDEEMGMVYCPHIVGSWVAEDFYCADGERKEKTDEQED